MPTHIFSETGSDYIRQAKEENMRKYMVYLDDGRDCFKVAVPATNEKAARKYLEGNGEVIAVKDITDDFPISLDKVIQALRNAQFGQTEIDLVARCLSFNDIAE